jgi:hypothetical protein
LVTKLSGCQYSCSPFFARAPSALSALISSRSFAAFSKSISFDASIISFSSELTTLRLSPSRNRMSRLMSSR